MFQRESLKAHLQCCSAQSTNKSPVHRMQSDIKCKWILLHSYQPVFWREGHLHAGGAGPGAAAPDGAAAPAHPLHAHCPPSPCHAPQTHRLCHEHPPEAHCQTGPYHFVSCSFQQTDIHTEICLYSYNSLYVFMPCDTHNFCANYNGTFSWIIFELVSVLICM